MQQAIEELTGADSAQITATRGISGIGPHHWLCRWGDALSGTHWRLLRTRHGRRRRRPSPLDHAETRIGRNAGNPCSAAIPWLAACRTVKECARAHSNRLLNLALG